jgi:hypothetical protein
MHGSLPLWQHGLRENLRANGGRPDTSSERLATVVSWVNTQIQ